MSNSYPNGNIAPNNFVYKTPEKAKYETFNVDTFISLSKPR